MDDKRKTTSFRSVFIMRAPERSVVTIDVTVEDRALGGRAVSILEAEVADILRRHHQPTRPVRLCTELGDPEA